MSFLQVSDITHGEHLAILRALRPRTAFLDFVYTAGLTDIEWTLEPPVWALELVEEDQVTSWPGGSSTTPCLRRRYVSAHSIFMAFRQQAGFFLYDGTGALRHTGFGSVDVSFLDRQQELIAYTSTGQGYVAISEQVADSLRGSGA
ncbi:MAG: hypothetical protein GX596_13675 [Propionibacterium sp.]|nr:hypothetical protein [Propionibacterium sp.]